MFNDLTFCMPQHTSSEVTVKGRGDLYTANNERRITARKVSEIKHYHRNTYFQRHDSFIYTKGGSIGFLSDDTVQL